MDTLYVYCPMLSDLHKCIYMYDYMLVVPPLRSTKKGVSMDHNNDVALNFCMKNNALDREEWMDNGESRIQQKVKRKHVSLSSCL
jgi:hypothetical protein